MKKILLVLEDYNEALFVETLLKKLGMVTESVRNEMAVAEKILGFLPDLVICTGDGAKINGNRVGQKVKKKGSPTKILLAFSRAKLADEIYLSSYVTDGVIETPINPRNLISTICQMLSIPIEKLSDKFEKLGMVLGNMSGADEVQIVTGMIPKPTNTAVGGRHLNPDEDRQRVKKYEALLKDLPEPPQKIFNKQTIKDEVALIRKEEAEDPSNQEINSQREDFVKKLFKK